MPQFNGSQWNGGSGGAALPRVVSATTLGYDAYRALGVLRAGQSANPEMIDDAFRALNDLVDSWNTESLTIPDIRRDLYELTGGQTEFTLGDLDETGVRPQKIEAVGLIRSGSTREVDLNQLTLDGYRRGLCGFYSDNAYPYAAVSIQPAAAAGDQLVLYSWHTLTGFADLEQNYTLPAGYARALKWALAEELAPAARIYAKVDQVLYESILSNARTSKGNIKRANHEGLLLEVDDALLGRGRFDIITGRYL